MATYTYAQLIAPKTNAQWKSQMLATLAAYGLPTSDWASGGVERTILEGDSQAMGDLAQAIVAITNGGFVSTSAGDWLTLLAAQLYELTRTAATFTQGNMTLTCAAGAGPYTISIGQLWAVGAGGNRYTNLTGGVLNAGPSTLVLSWQSESPNNSTAIPPLNYSDASATIIKLITPLPGVTINNPAANASSVSQVGTGTGTLTLTGTASGTHSVSINITLAGQSGVATWGYSLDGAPLVSAGAVASLLIPTTGITVALVNGSINPSFALNDTYFFSIPGSWITQAGVDVELDAVLRTRCLARWPSLSPVLTDSKYVQLTKAASSQVTQVKVTVDGFINNQVDIIIAGQAGVLPGSVVSAVQTYLNARTDITDRANVTSALNDTITITGSVNYYATYPTAQAVASASVANYVNTQGINGLIELSEVIALIRATPGVVDVIVSSVQINGVAINHQVNSLSVGVYGADGTAWTAQ